MAESVTTTDGDPGAIVEGYEALRGAVLGGAAQGWRHGYGVLATGGMAAWIAAWAPGASMPAAGMPARLSNPSCPSPSIPTPDHSTLWSLRNAGEIVSVVAQMALAHLWASNCRALNHPKEPR